MSMTTQHISTSALVGTALSVALAPRQGAASIEYGADLLKAFPGASFTNWVNDTDPCNETAKWQGVSCVQQNGHVVMFISLETDETTQPSSIPVDFTKFPWVVWKLTLIGPVFTESATNCGGLNRLDELELSNTTNFKAQCNWNELPLGNLNSLTLRNPGAQFSGAIPWSSFSQLTQTLVLSGMGLSGTIQLSELGNVQLGINNINTLDFSHNNFTHVNWDPSMSVFEIDVSNNEISQNITADELPRKARRLSLENNPLAAGSLSITSLPEAFRKTMSKTEFSESLRLSNTQLCFTGTPEDFQGLEGKPFLPRQCSIDQGRGLLAAFPGAFPHSWINHTDPCGINGNGPFWTGITCSTGRTVFGNENREALKLVTYVKVESYNTSSLIPVRFETIPSTVEVLLINGTSFKLANCTGLHGLSNLEEVALVSMTTPDVLCEWDDFPVDVNSWQVFIIQGQSVRFSSSVVPWSKFAGLISLNLTDNMGLTGTVDLALLCHVGSVTVPRNNFTHINWAPNCSCDDDPCMNHLDVSQNAIDQTITAGDLPTYIVSDDGESFFGLGFFGLNDNPALHGALNATEMPSGILQVINQHFAHMSDYFDIQNTGLCFTGMHNTSGATKLTQPQEDWFAARSCHTHTSSPPPAPSPTAAPTPPTVPTPPTASAHTGAIIAGSVIGSVAFLALIGACVARRATRRSSVTTEETEQPLTAEYEMHRIQ